MLLRQKPPLTAHTYLPKSKPKRDTESHVLSHWHLPVYIQDTNINKNHAYKSKTILYYLWYIDLSSIKLTSIKQSANISYSYIYTVIHDIP